MNAVKQAVALAKRVQPSTVVTRLAAKAIHVEGQIAHVERMKTGLFGIEDSARESAEERLDKLRKQSDQVKTEREGLIGLNKTSNKYLQLSLDPLGWRNKRGWPRLVVFALDSSDFSITSDGNISPDLPEPIQNKYSDVIRKLEAHERRSHSEDTVELTCTFKGLIPEGVKDKITAAQKDFDDDIYVIAEPTNFSVRRIARVSQDPLVVGFKHGALWLIADFETTPVEEAMKFSLIGKASKN